MDYDFFLNREVTIPLREHLAAGLRAALSICALPEWRQWAEACLDGTDRTAESARAASKTAMRASVALVKARGQFAPPDPDFDRERAALAAAGFIAEAVAMAVEAPKPLRPDQRHLVVSWAGEAIREARTAELLGGTVKR